MKNVRLVRKRQGAQFTTTEYKSFYASFCAAIAAMEMVLGIKIGR